MERDGQGDGPKPFTQYSAHSICIRSIARASMGGQRACEYATAWWCWPLEECTTAPSVWHRTSNRQPRSDEFAG